VQFWYGAIVKKAEDSGGVGTSKNQATVRLTEEQQQEFFKALCELGYVKDGKPMSAEFFRKCVEAVVHHYKEGDRLLLPVRFETIKAETWRKIAAGLEAEEKKD